MGKIRRERQKFHITATDDVVGMNEEPQAPKTPVSQLKKGTLLASPDNIFAGIHIKLDSVNKLPEPVSEVPKTPVKSVKPAPYKKEKTVAITTVPDVPSKLPSNVPEKQLTKKEKLKIRHEKLMQKIDVVQQAKQRANEKRNKKTKKERSLVDDVASLVASIQPKSPGTRVAPPRGKGVTSAVLSGIAVPSGSGPVVPKKKFNTSMKTIEEALHSLNDSLPSLDSILKLRSKDAKTGLDVDVVDGPVGKKGKKTVKPTVSSNSKNITRPNKSKELVKQYDHYQKLLKDDTYKSNPRAVIALHIKNKLRDRK